MEKIDRISFFNLGKFVKNGDDYFDSLEPGVAVLFGEDNNYVCYYNLDSDSTIIDKVEKLDAFDDWIDPVSDFSKNLLKLRMNYL